MQTELRPFAPGVRQLAACFGRSRSSIHELTQRKPLHRGQSIAPSKVKGRGYDLVEFCAWFIQTVRPRNDAPLPTLEDVLSRAKELGMPEYPVEIREKPAESASAGIPVDAPPPPLPPPQPAAPPPSSAMSAAKLLDGADETQIELVRRRADAQAKMNKAAREALKLDQEAGLLVPVEQLKSVVLATTRLIYRQLDNLQKSLPTDLQERPSDEIDQVLMTEFRQLKEEAARLALEEP